MTNICKERKFVSLLGAALVVALACCVPAAKADASGSGPQLLPAGYLSTRGNQIVDRRGHPVRIACVGGLGSVVDSGHLDYGYVPYQGLDANMAAIKKLGFNCIRVDFNDKVVSDAPMLADYDTLVAACKKLGLKVILCHHNDEATAKDWGNAAQQTNGLWFDSGPGTDGSDDSTGKPAGTITNEKFLQDWVSIAKRYAGNSTVIGFDLDNEPHNQYDNNSENWGQGGPCDIWAMYTNVGNAIQAVNPGALIICEGFMDVTDKSNPIWWMMDLSHVATKPVMLKIPNKVLYSVHEYPNEPHDSGPLYIQRLNLDWGYLVKQNIAPVWIGEMGESMDKAHDDVSIVRQMDWAATLLPYMDGLAPDGPRFTGDEQPVSGDWWWWNYAPDEIPDGCLTKDGQLNPAQKQFIEQMLFWPQGHQYSLSTGN